MKDALMLHVKDALMLHVMEWCSRKKSQMIACNFFHFDEDCDRRMALAVGGPGTPPRGASQPHSNEDSWRCVPQKL